MIEQKRRILVVDDEDAVVYSLSAILKAYDVTGCTKPEEALRMLREGERFDVLLIDFRMQGVSGLDLLFEAKKRLSRYRALLITAFSYRELLEEVINNDLIFRVVNKPFEPAEIRDIVSEAVDELEREFDEERYQSYLRGEIRALATSLRPHGPCLIHCTEVMKALVARARKCAASDANVLICGESGVGKEVVAEMIHSESPRSNGPMISMNCAAIPDQLFESELFGHKKGAFTGAGIDRPGKFQLAHGGTLFLDEIGELPLHQQSKLLRVIEDGCVTPLGAVEDEKVDVRIVCATNKDVSSMVSEGSFRSDLRYRLAVLSLALPPLRERREEIPLLAFYFLEELVNRHGGLTKHLTRNAVDYIQGLELAGNVRELKNLIHATYILSEGNSISREDVIAATDPGSESGMGWFEESMPLGEVERKYIEHQLRKHAYSMKDTAAALGMALSNFSRKLKQRDINVAFLKGKEPQ